MIPNPILNGELLRRLVPAQAAPWEEIERFALTFDGYRAFGNRLDELASRHNQAGTVPSDLAELRGCLFFEQRSWRHAQCRPDERGMRHIRALLEAIRSALPRDAEA
jgi:hypothetical protein